MRGRHAGLLTEIPHGVSVADATVAIVTNVTRSEAGMQLSLK
jgi:hypothetical protein